MENGVELRGCPFKFYQNLNGSASFTLFNSSKTFIKEIQTSLIKMPYEDTYNFQSIVIDSYVDIANFVKCKLYDSTIMDTPAESNFSTPITVNCE